MGNLGMTEGKKTWETPTLTELGLDLENVQNDVNNGTDGAGGFSATSMS